jgi:glycosyltransferase involved in cell wall biosynthesis
MKISAAIIAFNEERNISRVIESLRCCDEIVVVDSGSTDRTVELAAKHGARVFESVWRGFAGQKNYASERCENDWVLSLDADEALSESLEGEIWQIKKNGPEFDAYTMPRMAQYLGRWILHSGWYPDRKMRLFDRRRAKWVGDYVHESLVVDGRVGHLKSSILHFTCSSLSEHLKTMDRYTTLAAEQLVDQKKHVGWKQLALEPPWTFFQTYVLKRGFLDGPEGLAIAHMAALYNFLKYAKAKNMSPRR